MLNVAMGATLARINFSRPRSKNDLEPERQCQKYESLINLTPDQLLADDDMGQNDDDDFDVDVDIKEEDFDSIPYVQGSVGSFPVWPLLIFLYLMSYLILSCLIL